MLATRIGAAEQGGRQPSEHDPALATRIRLRRLVASGFVERGESIHADPHEYVDHAGQDQDLEIRLDLAQRRVVSAEPPGGRQRRVYAERSDQRAAQQVRHRQRQQVVTHDVAQRLRTENDSDGENAAGDEQHGHGQNDGSVRHVVWRQHELAERPDAAGFGGHGEGRAVEDEADVEHGREVTTLRVAPVVDGVGADAHRPAAAEGRVGRLDGLGRAERLRVAVAKGRAYTCAAAAARDGGQRE